MFTGIIEEVGRIERTSAKSDNIELTIKASKIPGDMKVGDSININGACQTVVERSSDSFSVEAVQETLRKTNLGQLRKNDLVNLERSLRFSDRLSGHLVTGHVDCVGTVKSVIKKDGSFLYEFELSGEYSAYLVEKGSVAVDGISLTVVQVKEKSFIVSVIPFTLQNTTLGTKRVGDLVNIETDLIGKYVVRITTSRKAKSVITEEWLKEKGW